mgnify:CR=1 FL=1
MKSNQCSGERLVAKLPGYEGRSQYTRYLECDKKSSCEHYMAPSVSGSRPGFSMSVEVPCPYYKAWKPGEIIEAQAGKE